MIRRSAESDSCKKSLLFQARDSRLFDKNESVRLFFFWRGTVKPPHRITADDWIFQAMSEIESADELQKLCLHFIQQLTADYKEGLIRNFVPPRANKHAFFFRYKTFRANAFFSLLTYILRIGTWHFIIAALFHFCTSNQKKRSVACL